jgi:hypothetical protein
MGQSGRDSLKLLLAAEVWQERKPRNGLHQDLYHAIRIAASAKELQLKYSIR